MTIFSSKVNRYGVWVNLTSYLGKSFPNKISYPELHCMTRGIVTILLPNIMETLHWT